MIFPFLELPGLVGRRPVVRVNLEGSPGSYLCLADTGTLHNRFGRWVAEAANLDVAPASEGEAVGVGGFTTRAVPARVQLRVGETSWEAPIWFCDPWPLDFQLLGLEGFFRWFEVTVKAAENILECTPEAR